MVDLRPVLRVTQISAPHLPVSLMSAPGAGRDLAGRAHLAGGEPGDPARLCCGHRAASGCGQRRGQKDRAQHTCSQPEARGRAHPQSFPSPLTGISVAHSACLSTRLSGPPGHRWFLVYPTAFWHLQPSALCSSHFLLPKSLFPLSTT